MVGIQYGDGISFQFGKPENITCVVDTLNVCAKLMEVSIVNSRASVSFCIPKDSKKDGSRETGDGVENE